MSIVKAIKKLFSAPKYEVRVVAGKECPVCGVDGLFRDYDNTYHCAECSTEFDENMTPKPKLQKPDQEDNDE